MAKPRFVPPTTEAALGTWAAQKRRLFVKHEEPVACTLGRLKSKLAAAGEGDPRIRQRWPEVYHGDGFLVQSIVCTLSELPRLTLTFFYVLHWPWHVPVSEQAEEIGIPKREYWNYLQIAEAVIHSGLQLLERENRKAPLPFPEKHRAALDL